jgi:hypothetical protein
MEEHDRTYSSERDGRAGLGCVISAWQAIDFTWTASINGAECQTITRPEVQSVRKTTPQLM